MKRGVGFGRLVGWLMRVMRRAVVDVETTMSDEVVNGLS